MPRCHPQNPDIFAETEIHMYSRQWVFLFILIASAKVLSSNHTCHNLSWSNCEIWEKFKWDFNKICEIFLSALYFVVQSNFSKLEAYLFIHVILPWIQIERFLFWKWKKMRISNFWFPDTYLINLNLTRKWIPSAPSRSNTLLLFIIYLIPLTV